MAWLAIILMCVAASVTYGIIHDQITARICLEYFTIGHPPILGGTDDPTLLAFGWGVIATWWVGAILGILLAASARAGSRPPRSPRTLLRPLGILMTASACFAAVAGITGYIAASNGWVWLLPHMAERIPADRHVPFLTDLWIHNASYLAGFVGGIVLCVVVYRSRRTSE